MLLIARRSGRGALTQRRLFHSQSLLVVRIAAALALAHFPSLEANVHDR